MAQVGANQVHSPSAGLFSLLPTLSALVSSLRRRADRKEVLAGLLSVACSATGAPAAIAWAPESSAPGADWPVVATRGPLDGSTLPLGATEAEALAFCAPTSLQLPGLALSGRPPFALAVRMPGEEGLVAIVAVLRADPWPGPEQALLTEVVELAAGMLALESSAVLDVDQMAVVSHELRTPLTTIKGFVKMLLDDRYSFSAEDARRYLSLVDGQADRLVRLLDGVLDATRLEGGMLKLRLETIDAQARIGGVVDVLASKYPERRIAVVASAGLLLTTDGDRVEQVLLNLIENALKYSGRDSTVEVGAEALGDAVRIWVRNQGQVAPAEVDRMFRKFVRLERHREAEGFGLGLYIAKRLVDLLGGRIAAESDGARITFSFALPRDPRPHLGDRTPT